MRRRFSTRQFSTAAPDRFELSQLLLLWSWVALPSQTTSRHTLFPTILSYFRSPYKCCNRTVAVMAAAYACKTRPPKVTTATLAARACSNSASHHLPSDPIMAVLVYGDS